MTYFTVRGIVPPGRIHHPVYGQVELFNISDDLAEKLWKEKCRFIQLSDEGRIKFLNQKPIQLHEIKPKKRKKNV